VSASIVADGREASKRWPRIARYLRAESPDWVDGDFHLWDWWVRDPAERADGYEEWAEFYEWRLALQARELAGDAHGRRIVERWTDDMAYLCRRCAVYARGEDPESGSLPGRDGPLDPPETCARRAEPCRKTTPAN
jgi:hypothetical protein